MDAAEVATGLQISVYLGAAGEDSRAHAENLFVTAGLHNRPALLMLVAPSDRKVEIVTAPAVQGRISDDDCARAIDAMLEHFRADDIVAGIEAGLFALVDAAGPCDQGDEPEELPDVLADPGFELD